MNRLTRVEGLSTLIKDGWKKKDTESYTSICYGCEEIGRCVNKCGFYKALEKLAAYEDLEEQGLLIKLPPIKTGDTLYWIWGDQIMPVKCRGIDRDVWYKMTTKEDRTFNKFDGTPFVYEKGDIRYFYAKDFGKTVFQTKEEAEKALNKEE